ncbi:MAG TPA: tetratricopeptide repeat protein, partial [Kofleriaceae bacterium]
DEATRLNDQVLASDRVHLGPKHPRTIGDLSSGGMLLFRAGRYAQAATQLKAALALEEEVSGPTSDRAAQLGGALGSAYMALGRMADAERRYRATVEVLASRRPASDFEVRGQRMNLAAVLILLGRYADAEAQLDALVAAARAASDDESLGLALQNLAEALTRDGKHARALAACREALVHDEKAFGASSRRGAEAYATLGTIHVALGQPDQAAEAYARSIDLFEHVVGVDTAELGDPLTALGELRLTRGDAPGARALLERAVKLSAGGDPVDFARSRFALARALLALHDPAAARTEASAAAGLLRGAGDRAAARRAQVEAWLAAHP